MLVSRNLKESIKLKQNHCGNIIVAMEINVISKFDSTNSSLADTNLILIKETS